MLKILKSKIHGATVTEADLNYAGSITIDSNLMKKAGLLPNECVLVADFNNGHRLETYVIEGKEGSGSICLNGPSAHLIPKGHKVAILAFKYLSESEISSHQPVIVIVNDKNIALDAK
ncbi:MAG: aspartate 1-decarboxylase [Candidatus Aminicenantes bacterium]|nr:MAG: aspartate 1-decarboxylase [Candidatus Aminicenantes bacterium]